MIAAAFLPQKSVKIVFPEYIIIKKCYFIAFKKIFVLFEALSVGILCLLKEQITVKS